MYCGHIKCKFQFLSIIFIIVVVLVTIQVDLLEPVAHFLDAARINLAPENLIVTEEHRAVNFFGVPLQVECFLYIY